MFARTKEERTSPLSEEDGTDGDDQAASDYHGEVSPGDDAEPIPASTDDDGAALRVHRVAISVGIVLVVTLGVLVGWLAFQVNRHDRTSGQRAVFEQTARQGAIDLTTIDWRQADADVQRILGAATGTFHDEFAQRSQPFVDLIKKSQSVTTGTVTASGLESVTNDDAQVMVAVSVRTSSGGAPESNPRAWRMRIAVQKVGDDVKVSNVEFVP
ncbi:MULTISPECIES: mammalian cell entry protein [Mycolicibacterium]|uniref:Mammalian cell entry protein n=1 Tax=Mycolicibacterium septicum DSM 44393 TaxID=1341646 RepID=A0A7X6RZK6_9MYCO|nr:MULTISPECIES: mammalian cell entry protein [Mycolicibacterium]MBX8690354.1 mammalian cell entry protein [Mycobacterium sp. 20091114027_K0903767]MCP3811300.1 mammalian cell entry protein [Mycobacteriaceae bacterium Msp059]NKZ14920.1 mammalian cell entry protein [Mycolicibacterium septicum DSM 44393]